MADLLGGRVVLEQGDDPFELLVDQFLAPRVPLLLSMRDLVTDLVGLLKRRKRQ